MSKPIIIGFPQSSYVWTARAACNYKGIEHEFQPLGLGSHRTPEHLARHPWGKVPTFEHGDVRLYETTAICAYIDAAFEGPALQPREALPLARMHLFVSIVNSYLYPKAVPDYILQYVFAGDTGPNRAVIDPALPIIRKTLEILDAEAGDKHKWLVGDNITLADLSVFPLVLAVGMFPEGEQLTSGLGNLARLKKQITDEAKFMSCMPSV